MKIPRRILPVIVFSQFCCTSLWFAGNAIMPDLLNEFSLMSSSLGHLTSAVQLGFILGTLSFAFLSIADRFSPSKVFFFCALLGGIFNLGTLLENNDLLSLVIFRFLTGFALAGIYPVGMKIASDYFEKGLGISLGYLVGALVLGTAFPHLLKAISAEIELAWRWVIYGTSILATLGGTLIVVFVPNGPFRFKRTNTDFGLVLKVFRNTDFRSAAFGYFGHMWELYAFWTFLPVILNFYKQTSPSANFSIALTSFLIIGLGGVACVIGGYVSEKIGLKRTAASALFLSGVCCLTSPIIFFIGSEFLLIGFLIFWGLVVVADSPLFSTLVAHNVNADARGTALTIVNCMGFSITIISIQLLNYFSTAISPVWILLFLSPGPVLGLLSLFKKKN